MTSSATWGHRSLAVFPGGSNGEFNLPADLATVIRSGKGCQLVSADGQAMLDFSMGWGSVLVGHADPRIIEPVARRLADGTNFATVTDASAELAERLVKISPACEQVRFSASGTEATMYCLRVARAATGKSAVMKFEGAYHGAHDVGVTNLFSTSPTPPPTAVPSCDGLTAHLDGGVLVAPFNDLERTEQLLRDHADQLAAVIVEPLQRCLPPEPGFLEGLRRVTAECGVLLVFDEVVTGFRLAYGGAQEYYGVVPDLVAYGKALGGGMPIGVFGGRENLMTLASEDRAGHATYVWTASTLGGNPISSTAALATLNVLREPDTYPQLHSLGRYLRDGLRRVFADFHVEAQILGDGPLAQFALTSQEATDYWSSQHQDRALARRIMLGLFRRGIFLNPMGTKLYLSLAHDKGACDRLLATLGDVLADVTQQASLAK